MTVIMREEHFGPVTLRLLKRQADYLGVLLVGSEPPRLHNGSDPAAVWRYLEGAWAAIDPGFFGYGGAESRFLRHFPRGFADATFLRDERDYKIAAKKLLDTTMPLEAALNGTGFGLAALSVFQRTNMLHHIEKAKLSDFFRTPAADTFINGAARFASGDIEPGLTTMIYALKPFDMATWTVATYLPFLWQPEVHIFLKPEVTKKFADRVGHPFSREYKSSLSGYVYDCLLDLTNEIRSRLTSLSPRDNIDIQSFIWAVGAYPVQ